MAMKITAGIGRKLGLPGYSSARPVATSSSRPSRTCLATRSPSASGSVRPLRPAARRSPRSWPAKRPSPPATGPAKRPLTARPRIGTVLRRVPAAAMVTRAAATGTLPATNNSISPGNSPRRSKAWASVAWKTWPRGGFAPVRSKAAKMDLSKYDGLLFKVRGDGRGA